LPRDPKDNPYAPGAGTPPPELAGRDPQLRQFGLLLERLSAGASEKSIIVTGMRGTGKTVLLEAFEEIADEHKWSHEYYEVDSATNLPVVLARLIRRALLDMSLKARVKERLNRALSVLKSFSLTIDGVNVGIEGPAAVGRADSGDLRSDLIDLLLAVGEGAREARTGVVLLLDEVQFAHAQQYEALIVAMHRVAQKSLPVAFVAAGLPLLPRLGSEAKPYAERMFDYVTIGGLTRAEMEDALVIPARERKVEYEPAALERLYGLTEGYAYFVQEYGKRVWLASDNPTITLKEVEAAHPIVREYLDQGFFEVRMSGLAPSKLRYLSALADLGDGPQRAAEVARRAGYKTAQQATSIRADLIDDALVYVPERGKLDFTVPQCADYMRRRHPLAVDSRI
jgi:AAA ATPase domain